MSIASRVSLARLAAAAIGLVIVADGSAARAANYTSRWTVARQTAGNPRFWAASVGTGTASLTLRADLQTHYKIGNRELGFQRVRGHGVLNDDMGIYKGAGLLRLDEIRQVPERDRLRRGCARSWSSASCPTALAASGNNTTRRATYTTLQAVHPGRGPALRGQVRRGRRRAMVLGGLERAGLRRVLDRHDGRLLHPLRQRGRRASPPCFPTRTSEGRRRPSQARSPRSCSTARPRTSA